MTLQILYRSKTQRRASKVKNNANECKMEERRFIFMPSPAVNCLPAGPLPSYTQISSTSPSHILYLCKVTFTPFAYRYAVLVQIRIIHVHPLLVSSIIAWNRSNVVIYSLILARMSWSRKSEYSSSPTLTGDPPYWGIKTLSPGCTLQAILLPSLSSPPGPTARTFASFNSLTLDSGR